MGKRVLWMLALTAVLAGCRRAPVAEVADEQPAADAQPAASTLTSLLDKPRDELALQGGEIGKRLQDQERARRDAKQRFTLLPTLRLPVVLPVWRESTYNGDLGFSLPPYMAEGGKDTELAVHLARYGDLEAARKLADTADAGAAARLDAYKYERNYPVEWTRLMALQMLAAETRLANNDFDAASEIISLHKQIRSALDARAAAGPLGAALLARGRTALALAAAAWQREQKTELVDTIKAGLADWGEVPLPSLPVRAGASAAEVNRIFRSTGEGRALPALSRLRAFDLLGVPLPHEGADAVVACLDADNRLAEILITYRPRLNEQYPDPDQLAHLLEDFPEAGQPVPKAPGIRRRSYQLGETAGDVAILPFSSILGGFARLRDSKAVPAPVALERSLGAVLLDRTFEQNRLHFSPEQRKNVLAISQPKSLERVRNPVGGLKPAQALLEQEAGHNLTARLVLRYGKEDPMPPLHEVAGPLWAAAGPARLESVEDMDQSGFLALVWEDAATRYTLRLPYSASRNVEFEAANRTEKPAKEREAAALAFDRNERRSRVEQGKPLVRVPRFVEQLELGMTRTQVLEALPAGQAVLKQATPGGGLMITFNAEPPPMATYVPRMLFARFNQAGRAVELRGRYVDGPAAKTAAWMVDLQGELRKRMAPEELPASWTQLWADLPPKKPTPTLYRWTDDLTVRTFQRDADGVEVIVLDRPLQYENGVPLPPLEYLSHGPPGCVLGSRRDDLLKKWKIAKPVLVGEALVLTPRDVELYDGYLVWFDKENRVTRVTARHARRPDPSKLNEEITQAWGEELRLRELETFGWPRRQDFTPQGVRQSIAWHDDRTRFRIFWQPSETGPPRLYTEWSAVTLP